MAWNLHVIEQTHSRRYLGVDGVGRLNFDLHTGRLPPRHQSGDLNYFGATPGPVEDLLIAVQTEMMRMGSPMVCALCGNQPVKSTSEV